MHLAGNRCIFVAYLAFNFHSNKGDNRLKGGLFMDQISQIMAYEDGRLGNEETIALFQELINSGLVWKLQGSYGRTAKALIEEGYCTAV